MHPHKEMTWIYKKNCGKLQSLDHYSTFEMLHHLAKHRYNLYAIIVHIMLHEGIFQYTKVAAFQLAGLAVLFIA